MEIISPLTFVLTVFDNDLNLYDLQSIQLICICCFTVHYFNRSIVYPLTNPSKSKSHLLVLASAITFNVVNGYLQGYHVARIRNDEINYKTIIGLIFFILGFILNIYHDRLLFNLKLTSNGQYLLPVGGLFNLISYPNYLW